MNPYKRPEKETDPDKYPGQIVNRPPTHVGTLKQEIQEFLDTEEMFTPISCVYEPLVTCPSNANCCRATGRIKNNP